MSRYALLLSALLGSMTVLVAAVPPDAWRAQLPMLSAIAWSSALHELTLWLACVVGCFALGALCDLAGGPSPSDLTLHP